MKRLILATMFLVTWNEYKAVPDNSKFSESIKECICRIETESNSFVTDSEMDARTKMSVLKTENKLDVQLWELIEKKP